MVCIGEVSLNHVHASTETGDQFVGSFPGGQPFNVACSAALLGVPVGFLGRFSEDAIGRQLGSLLTSLNIAPVALQFDSDRPTRTAEVFLNRNGGHERTNFLGSQDVGFADQALVPETLAESIMPYLDEARWLLVATNSLKELSNYMAISLLLKRARAQGVCVALDVAWQPSFWGLPPGSAPSADVLQRFKLLSEAASLIHCTKEEADHFFGTTDATAIHGQLANRPSVLIPGPTGTIQWCLGGHRGLLALNSQDDGGSCSQNFLAAVLDGLCSQPELVGKSAAGSRGLASAAQVEELLRFASAYAISSHPLSSNRRL
ncbi:MULTISPECIES: PfkB family carbohydrate kinase [unclassified Synechococcus]|uniref:PfkB family carbohydrate kinase n=1 Tax=unclassified Synechococcus TaxID=2626047 RepID=UPI0021028528|nr:MULTISPECIES: PfkB family carbohydrate kinase [unclassified Synechococcus]MCT4363751.1 PfkB family carbohydrate kinase [Candidatus Regnicoccus frigidus MAG-AL1]MCT4367576.1 PfkB family carbohydrate kinase [Candidatus Regnicoccus frigidus MAG-AL2]